MLKNGITIDVVIAFLVFSILINFSLLQPFINIVKGILKEATRTGKKIMFGLDRILIKRTKKGLSFRALQYWVDAVNFF